MTAIFTTVDGGKSWHPHEVAFQTDQGAVLCPTSLVCYLTSYDTIWQTTDGGDTWISPTSAKSSLIRRAHPISCVGPQTCVVATDLGVVVTLDGGATWNTYAFAMDTTAPFDPTGISCPSITFCMLVGWNAWEENPYQTVMTTTDGGKHWQKQSPGTHSGLSASHLRPLPPESPRAGSSAASAIIVL